MGACKVPEPVLGNASRINRGAEVVSGLTDDMGETHLQSALDERQTCAECARVESQKYL